MPPTTCWTASGRIEEELDRLDALAGRLAMETGEFWRQTRAVDRRTCVDRQLLSDLSALERDLLLAKLDRSGAQGLIGRSIFAQYLIDRGNRYASIPGRRVRAWRALVYPARPRRHGAVVRLASRYVQRRYVPLREWRRYRNASICSGWRDFLDAVDPESGQGTFFPYQFDVIPVELISSIYEQFAHSDATSRGGGRANGRSLHAIVARVAGSRRDHRWIKRRRDRSRLKLRVGRLSGRGSSEARRAALRYRAAESEDNPVHVASADLRRGHKRGCGTGCGIQSLSGGIGTRSRAETAKRPEVPTSNRQNAHHRRRMECREHTARKRRTDPERQVQDVRRHCGKPAMELSG